MYKIYLKGYKSVSWGKVIGICHAEMRVKHEADEICINGNRQ